MNKINKFKVVCKFTLGAILVYGLSELLIFGIDKIPGIYDCTHWFPYATKRLVFLVCFGSYTASCRCYNK